MTRTVSVAAASTPNAPIQPSLPADYQAGVCNIGPEEIARRRRAGHFGAAITVGLLIGLIALGVPPVFRLVVFLPAAAAASGYLQAWLKFCAGFGRLGVYNFGQVGPMSPVIDDASRAADRRKSTRIGIASAVIGLVVAVIAVLLPV
jgi:hypothetical protein